MSELALPQDRTSTIELPEGSRKRLAPLVAVVVVLMVMLLALAEAMREKSALAADRAQAVRNCHEIILRVRYYSADMQGLYPYQLSKPSFIYSAGEVKNSNEVFRELFVQGLCAVNDEVIFSCPRSPFRPDGRVGVAPTFAEALQKKENHWAMTGNLLDSSPNDLPLIFENPADAVLPLRWDSDAAGKEKAGRCWGDRKIVVGFNDASIRWLPLEPGPGLRKLEMITRRDRNGGDRTLMEEVFPPELNDHWVSEPILQVDE